MIDWDRNRFQLSDWSLTGLGPIMSRRSGLRTFDLVIAIITSK